MAKIVVVGAGIGGLTVGAALRKSGHEVIVLERAPQMQPVGAGLTVQPNAVLALRRLDLTAQLEGVAAELYAVAITSANGTVLSHLSAQAAIELVAAVGAPAWGLHRATLQEALSAELGADVLQLGTEVVQVDPENSRVSLADGRELTSDLLIGADGINSTVRTAICGDQPTRYSGYTCWRGVTAQSAYPRDWAGEYWGKGRRFGGCAIDGNRTYWFAVANAKQGGHDSHGAKAAAQAVVQDFPEQARATSGATPPEAIFRTDISDRQPINTWVRGATALLGDAAHPMTPNLGQGACQAIEDALVLHDAIARHGATATALQQYQQLRAKRANAVVNRARQLGKIAQSNGNISARLRDTVMRTTPERMLFNQLRDAWKLPY